MKPSLKQDYRNIRAFFPNFDDAHLAAFLDHLRAGKFSYTSCCCFIGAATADHALSSSKEGGYLFERHYIKAAVLPGATQAEVAVSRWIVPSASCDLWNALRTRRLIAMVKAEIRRRHRVGVAVDAPVEAVHA